MKTFSDQVLPIKIRAQTFWRGGEFQHNLFLLFPRLDCSKRQLCLCFSAPVNHLFFLRSKSVHRTGQLPPVSATYFPHPCENSGVFLNYREHANGHNLQVVCLQFAHLIFFSPFCHYTSDIPLHLIRSVCTVFEQDFQALRHCKITVIFQCQYFNSVSQRWLWWHFQYLFALLSPVPAAGRACLNSVPSSALWTRAWLCSQCRHRSEWCQQPTCRRRCREGPHTAARYTPHTRLLQQLHWQQ